MDKKKQPGINTVAIMLISDSFVRYPEIPRSVQTSLNFTYSYSCTPDGQGSGELTLKTTGRASENDAPIYEAEIKYVGIFQADKENPNMQIVEFMKSHAPAHIFPYLREFLSSLSSRAGLPTIILPPLNILALTKVIDEREIESHPNQ